MTTGGQKALEVARTQLGVMEAPANSNNVSYWDWWGDRDGAVESWEILGAWCAAFVSWCYAEAGAPLAELQTPGRPGFVGVQAGVAKAVRSKETTNSPQPGDIVLYSWLPVEWRDGLPMVWYQNGWVTAGDHTGLVDHVDSSTVWSLEGNTSALGSQDNGGAVLLRARPRSQVICFWHPPQADIQVGGEFATQRNEGEVEVPGLLCKVRDDPTGSIFGCFSDGIYRGLSGPEYEEWKSKVKTITHTADEWKTLKSWGRVA